jgi:cellulose synthase/poly-beta-1,6-N-acetylglucosamine synthase-like glycosyltransferase
LVIPVYNEEKIIERKIKNSLLLDYAKDKLEIVVASDGSTDNTKQIVEKYLDMGIRFFDFPRAGKLATLNRVIPETNGEILVLTDANVMLTHGTLRNLVKHFVNNDIGVVSGVEKISAKKDFISKHERSYWNYEIKMKELEGWIFSTVGACGPLYAIRRELFPQIPSHLNVCDDMTISLNAVQKGKRIVLERKALALEDASMSVQEEWRRKKRIATRAWQSLFYHKNLLIPFKSPIAFPLIFHKLLRWLTIFFMLLLFISNLFIIEGFYLITFLVQTVLYILSIIGLVFLLTGKSIPSIVSSMSYFLLTQCAQIVGLYNSLFKKGKPIWQPIQRAD